MKWPSRTAFEIVGVGLAIVVVVFAWWREEQAQRTRLAEVPAAGAATEAH